MIYLAGHDTDVVGQMLCPVLVGRDEEFALLRQAIDRAAGGHGGTMVVVGEAGVGKSRLARELSRTARDRGLVVLTGRAVASGVPVAYRPLSEAVLGALRDRGEVDLPQLRAFRPALGRLVPHWLPPQPAASIESAVVLGEGLLRLLRGLAGERACVLVLEDVHWADPESLAVLEYLADNIASEPISVLVTLRPEGFGSATTLLAGLASRRVVTTVTLSRLEKDDVVRVTQACLDTRDLPAPLPGFLTAHCDGLPFLVEELLASLVTEGILVDRDGNWSLTRPLTSHVPPAFSVDISRRMKRLPPETTEVMRAAATLGRRFDWSLLAEALGQSADGVLAALRRAVDAQLVTADDSGFRFRHALTREAVLAELLPPDRVRFAARMLSAVETAHPGLPGEWCELAAGLAQEARQPTRSAELLLTAGQRGIAAGALGSAEALLEHSRRLVGDDPGLMTRVDEALTDALALAGRVDEAFEVGSRLLGRLDLRSRLPTGGVDLHLRLARAAITAARWPVAADHLAAARASSRTDELIARIDALDAQVALGEGRVGDAESLATRALKAAEQESLPAVACEALEVGGRVARQRDLEAAESRFSRELAVASAHGLRLWQVRALHELGTIDQLRTESVDRLEEARELALDLGAVGLVATLDLQIAAGLLKQFRPSEGLVAARRSVEVSRHLDLATLPMALVLEATAYAQSGELAEMEDCVAQALVLAPDDPDVVGSAWGHCRATAALLAEDRERAIAQMTTGAGLLLASPAGIAPPFLGLRVLLLAIDGDVTTVRAAAERVRSSGVTRHRIVGSLLGYADAVLLGRAGRRGDAQAAYDAADSGMGDLVAWYRQYARRVVAESALDHDWGEPVAWLREAAGFFADRGDQQIAATCRALLRQAGAVVPRAGRGDSAVPGRLRALGVTSREVDVGRLLADGLTNAEIGDRLFLSSRTVEKHVAALLHKTGCRGRTQLAGCWAQLTG